MFGFPVPEPVTTKHGEPKFYWGARGIYTPPKFQTVGYGRKAKEQQVSCNLDIWGERSSTAGFTDEKTPEGEAFFNWINKVAIPALRKWCDTQWIETSSRKVFALRHERWTMMASPNASYGYIYVGVWEYPAEADATNDAAIKEWQDARNDARKP